ncbi:MAG TPA: OmpH family outer membrane protein, partial [Alphaproteobacteria bacterium]|nr:OmpH family outer membrane protein [Alphaproteobacteria bacterium]
MRLLKPVIFFIFAAAFILVAPGHPFAQEKKAKVGKKTSYVNVAIIDVNEIRRKAKVVQNIRDQINKYRKIFQAEIKKEEDKLRKANQELSRQRAILSPEAFAEERRKFEQRLVGVQRKVRERRRSLDRAFSTSMRAVEKRLSIIVTGIAKIKKLSLILRLDQTVLAAQALSITNDALAVLDRK